VPRIIREAFAERVRRSAVLQAVLDDIGEVSGLKIQFYEAARQGDITPPCQAHSPLCRQLNKSPAGRDLCRNTCLLLLEEARAATRETRCAAGTTFCAVPLRSSAGLLGFLVAAGFYPTRPNAHARNRYRHLFERAGIRLTATRIERLCAGTKLLAPQRLNSLRHILEIAAGYLVKELALELFQKGGDLPKPILRACQLIRERFRDDPAQEDIARAVGLSTSHFSRLFHRRTGLRYKEYLNEVRLQESRRALRETDHPVTQVAFDAGFRSISQFNRQFKTHYDASPRDYRKRYRPTPGTGLRPAKALP
jgi:AraC-like DNA-binding protein